MKISFKMISWYELSIWNDFGQLQSLKNWIILICFHFKNSIEVRKFLIPGSFPIHLLHFITSISFSCLFIVNRPHISFDTCSVLEHIFSFRILLKEERSLFLKNRIYSIDFRAFIIYSNFKTSRHLFMQLSPK